MEFMIPAMKLHTESTVARISGLLLHVRPATISRCMELLAAVKQNNISNHSLLDSLNSSLHSYTSHENYVELANEMSVSFQQQSGSAPETTPPQSDSSYEDTSRALNKLATVVENIFARMRITVENIRIVFDCAVNRVGDEVGIELVIDRLSVLDQSAAEQAAASSPPPSPQSQQPQASSASNTALPPSGNNQLRKNIELSGVRLFFRRAVSPPPSPSDTREPGLNLNLNLNQKLGAGDSPYSVPSSIATDYASFYSVASSARSPPPPPARPLLSPVADSSIYVPSASANASSNAYTASNDVLVCTVLVF